MIVEQARRGMRYLRHETVPVEARHDVDDRDPDLIEPELERQVNIEHRIKIRNASYYTNKF